MRRNKQIKKKVKRGVKENFKGRMKVIVELGVGVLAVGAAGYALWMLHGRKAMLRRHVLRQRKIRKYLEEE